MRKILDVISRDECVSCTTLDEAIEYCNIAHEQGLTWITGDSYNGDTQWEEHECATVYYPNRGIYGSAINKKQYVKIVPFNEFKNRLKEGNMSKELKIEIPEGFEFDCVENGVIKCKEVKKELPKTIKDCIDLLRKQNKNCYWVSVTSGSINESRYNYNVGDLPSEKIAIAIRALQKLLVAREVYRDGWEPDWTDGAHKYIIYMNGSCLYKSSSISTNRVLAFQTYEIRDLFYDNFKDLIEEAKELL